MHCVYTQVDLCDVITERLLIMTAVLAMDVYSAAHCTVNVHMYYKSELNGAKEIHSAVYLSIRLAEQLQANCRVMNEHLCRLEHTVNSQKEHP